jgi:hypothetical protein
MLDFRGSLNDLQDTLMQSAIPGERSSHKKSRFYRFQAATGAILNWWPSTGTINSRGTTPSNSRPSSSNMGAVRTRLDQ